MDIWDKLYNAALEVQNARVVSPFIEAGGVAAAIAEESRTHTPCDEQFLRLSPDLVLQDRHLASTRFD